MAMPLENLSHVHGSVVCAMMVDVNAGGGRAHALDHDANKNEDVRGYEEANGQSAPLMMMAHVSDYVRG